VEPFSERPPGAIAGARTPRASIGKLAIASRSNDSLRGRRLGVQSRRHLSQRTSRWRREASSGCSGNTLDENALSAVKSTAGWYVVKLDSPMTPCASPRPLTKSLSTRRLRPRPRRNPPSPAGFVKQFGNIELLILTIGSVVFFTLLLVTATPWLSLSGAHLRTGGPKSHRLFRPAVLFLRSGRVRRNRPRWRSPGLTLAYLAIPVIGVALTGLLPPLILSKSLLTLGLAFALFVGAASGLLPGIWRHAHARG